MKSVGQRIAKLERRYTTDTPDYDGLLPADDIVRYLEHHRRQRPGRDERVPLATWRRLAETQLELWGGE